ncbi:AT-hook motif nuclear-localized protein 14 [Bienertia sinuspersici]
MEPNESGLTSFYHPHQQHQHPHPQQHESGLTPPPHATATATTTTANSPVTNGISDVANSLSYPQSVTGKAPDPQRRKRGRPRKYGTPEAAAAAKRAAAPIKRKEQHLNQQQQHHQHHFIHGSSSHSSSASSKKSNFVSVGGQGFTPHVINVAAGEDVGQKIMLFMQQTRRELCILSASGSIASASLRQPAISGGNMTYQGCFDIISLTGSYVRSDLGGKAGGLSACLSSATGGIVGGGIGGPLIAAGPVEVIVGTFVMDHKKDASAGFKGEVSANTTIASPVSASTAVYRPVVESSGGFTVTTGGDDHQNMDGNPFMMQSQWRSGISYDLGGNAGHSSHDSPENGDYEQMPD